MNEYVRVYRVEHKKHNCGPYVNTTLKDKAVQKAHDVICEVHCGNLEAWPALWHDFADKYRGEAFNEIYSMFCGCEHLEQIYNWFDGFRDLLRECGFVVKAYRVKREDIRYGKSGRQIFFKKPLSPVQILPIAVDGCF